jgi:iron-sulfur cluster repair protein YtfE (RIC family)
MKNTDALKLLQEQHREVRKLLEDLSSTTTRAEKTRARLLPELETKLRGHMRIEEEIFYPAFRDAAENEKEQQLFFEALDEHRAAEMELDELCKQEVTDVRFSAKAKVLKDMVEHHLDEEEKILFPKVRELFEKEQLSDLGAQMLERFQELAGQHAKSAAA